MDLEELKSRILDRYSVDELVDVLGLDVSDIFDAFEDTILDCMEELDI